MANYFRITAYSPAEDVGMIVDSNGRHEKLWQFSAERTAISQKPGKAINCSCAPA